MMLEEHVNDGEQTDREITICFALSMTQSSITATQLSLPIHLTFSNQHSIHSCDINNVCNNDFVWNKIVCLCICMKDCEREWALKSETVLKIRMWLLLRVSSWRRGVQCFEFLLVWNHPAGFHVWNILIKGTGWWYEKLLSHR